MMLAIKSRLFEKAIRIVEPSGGGCFYYAGKPGNLDQHKKYGIFQSLPENNMEGKFSMEVQQHKVNGSSENLKEVLPNHSKLVPLASMFLIRPVARKLFTEKIPNIPVGRRISQFVKKWKKLHLTKKFYQ